MCALRGDECNYQIFTNESQMAVSEVPSSFMPSIQIQQNFQRCLCEKYRLQGRAVLFLLHHPKDNSLWHSGGFIAARLLWALVSIFAMESTNLA